MTQNPSAARTEIVFVFDNLPDWQHLAAGVQANVQVVVLDGTQDGLAQIAAQLKGREGVDAIHILSHGSAGRMQLGGSSLGVEEALAHSDLLALIGDSIAVDGDILLYGCNIGADGGKLLQLLANQTGADVAASDDFTGNADKGGDWVLESVVGFVDSGSVLNVAALSDYDALLAAVTIEFGDRGFTPEQDLNVVSHSALATSFSIFTSDFAGVADAAHPLRYNHYDGLGTWVGEWFPTEMPTTGPNDGVANASGDGGDQYKVPLALTVKTADGSEFALIGFNAEQLDYGLFSNYGAYLTIDAYRDGSKVGTENVYANSNSPDWYSTITMSAPAFQNVDEIRLYLDAANTPDWDATQPGLNFQFDRFVVDYAPPPTPTITSATYDASTGTLVVTGTNFVGLAGATNDIVANKFTLTGEGGATYTLTDTSDVEITSATSFTLVLSATDRAGVSLIANKNGTSATGGATYNLAAAEDWAAGADAAVVVADTTGNSVTVSDVAVPTITSAAYDASTGVIVITGTGLKSLSGATNDIVANKFTLTGEGSSTYTLTDTSNVEITSATSFALVLSATDRAGVSLIANKNGTSATGGATYNLAAAEDWAAGADAAVVVADTTGNGVTVSNVAAPTITSATYNASTGALVVTGTGFLSRAGASNDIVANKFTLRGEAGIPYQLSSTSNVEITSGTSFTLTLSDADRGLFNAIANKNGTNSTGGMAYNLAAAEDWAAGAAAAVVVADTTGNPITVSNVPVPTIDDAQYDAATGVLVVWGTGFTLLDATNDIVANKFTITGQGGAYTLTDTANVTIESGTLFALTLSATDKLAVQTLLNKNGFSSSGGTVYNLAAAEDWAAGADAALVVADSTNAINVSNFDPPPTLIITSDVPTLKAGETATITFTFSEDPGSSFVWDGSSGDVVVTGGTLGAISGSGLTRTALFTPTADTDAGTASITVLAGAYTDTAGNLGEAGVTPTLNFDTLHPATTIASVVLSADTGASASDFVTNTASQTISGTLSANLAVGESVQVSLDAGATWSTATASVGSNSWTLAGQTLMASNTLQARVVDAAGNAGTASSQPYTLDTTAPSPTGGTPADDATGVSIANDIVLTFSEALDPADSDLTKVYLKDVATDTLVPASITINGSGALVINPTGSLAYSKAYYVTWEDTALTDIAGNFAAAVSDETTYNFTTQAAPVIPDPDPGIPTPPIPPVIPSVPDNDGIPAEVEDKTPGIPNPDGITVEGDGNGDGIKDSQQAEVASIGFLLSPTAESNPGSAPPTFTTLVASSLNGKVGSGGENSRILSLGQKDAPDNLPEGMETPIGLISFTVELGQGKTSESFSLYLDPALGVNGYWKQDAGGTWINIASEPYGGKMVMEGGRVRLDFQIEDGGQFDADGKVDGIITDPGAPGYMPLSIAGQAPDMGHGGFWF